MCEFFLDFHAYFNIFAAALQGARWENLIPVTPFSPPFSAGAVDSGGGRTV